MLGQAWGYWETLLVGEFFKLDLYDNTLLDFISSGICIGDRWAFQILGAVRFSNNWAIPKDAVKPKDGKYKKNNKSDKAWRI